MIFRPNGVRQFAPQEALSVIHAPAVDAKTKRLRLTIGNGHGISSVIDEALRHDIDDHKQSDFEASQSTTVQEQKCPRRIVPPGGETSYATPLRAIGRCSSIIPPSWLP